MKTLAELYEPVRQHVDGFRSKYEGGEQILMPDFDDRLAQEVSANVVHSVGVGTDEHVFLSFAAGYWGSPTIIDHKTGTFDVWWQEMVGQIAVAIGWDFRRTQRAIKNVRECGWMVAYPRGKYGNVYRIQNLIPMEDMLR